MISTWSCTLPDGAKSEELLLTIGEASELRILVIPPLFGEHNTMRRHLVTVMRMLSEYNIASVLADLPGWNESLVPSSGQTLATWRAAISEIFEASRATHFLAVRSGALLAPRDNPGWLYAPQSGAKLLRGLIRARTIASREAGYDESSDGLFAKGLEEGLNLGGWQLGKDMVGGLNSAEIEASDKHRIIEQGKIGGAGVWLRAEPDEDQIQAKALANLISEDIEGAA